MSMSAATGSSIQNRNPRASTGNVPGYRKLPNFSPEMQRVFDQLLGKLGGGQGLEQGLDYQNRLAAGDEDAFKQLEAPAYSAFQQGLGQIGSRFAGAGALGSSAFQNATAGEARKLAENLGAQRHGIQEGALDRLLGLSERLLGKEPFALEKKDKGFDWGSLLGGLGSKALGSIGGPIGPALGEALLPKILKALGLG